jgi:hypothetical protein
LPPQDKAVALKKLRERTARLPSSAESNTAYEGNWRRWLLHYFPQAFSRPFAAYQTEFWRDWAWNAEPGKGFRPRVECQPRGVGKSTSAETFVVLGLARKRFKTVGYVSRTGDKAQQHFAAIKRKLENPQLLKDYPHLAPRVEHYRHRLSSWSQDRLITEDGRMVIPVTLLGSRRGFKSEDDVRFDLIILDDIDELGESHALREKNLELLKAEILAAGDNDTVVLFAQNLIHKDSICSQVLDHRADILSERDFRGAYPLMKWYDAEKIELEDGARRWTITAGESYDPAIDVAYCESLLNKFGKATFDRECQQRTDLVSGEKSFREYDETLHVITWPEFAKVYGERRPPARWHKARGLDWGTTKEHPTACVMATRPTKTDPLDDCVFVISEVVRPQFPSPDPYGEPEIVSPGRVSRAINESQKRLGIGDDQIKKSLMSHEASAALATFVIDLSEENKQFFSKWKAKKGSGVAQIQELMAVDVKCPHPFRRDPVTNERLQGRPRLYFVVEDGQGELYYDAEGRLRVRGARDALGLARLRAEIPEFDDAASGTNKTFDDAVDALRGMAAAFFVDPDDLTDEERTERKLPSKIRKENIRRLPVAEQARAVLANQMWKEELTEPKEDEMDGFYWEQRLT